MPRFFFDTDNGVAPMQDTEGLDLPDKDSAQAQAVMALPGLARDALLDGSTRAFASVVRGENGRAVFVANIAGVFGTGRSGVLSKT